MSGEKNAFKHSKMKIRFILPEMVKITILKHETSGAAFKGTPNI